MTKDQTHRIALLQVEIDDTYFIMGGDCISTEYINELFEKVCSLEDQQQVIEDEGKNFCEVCDVEVGEKVIDKYRKAYDSQEIYRHICSSCNDFDPLEL